MEHNEDESNWLHLSTFLKENNVIIIDKNMSQSKIIDFIIDKYSPANAFFIIDLGALIKRIKLWRELFPNIDPYFAIKSNSNKVLLELMSKYNINFDVASKGEISIAKQYVDSNRIIYSNPIKEQQHLSFARGQDVDLTVIDNEHEIIKLSLYHPDASVLIRLKVDDSESECKFSGKFGAEIDEIPGFLELAKILKINVIGTSFHVGSNSKNADQFKKAIKLCRNVFDIAKEKGFNFHICDIGGGFTGLNDDVNMKLLKETSLKINEGFEEYFSEYMKHEDDSDSIKNVENEFKIIAEPGRFMVASTHTLVFSIIGKKNQKVQGEVINQYSVNDSIYGTFNCISNDHQQLTFHPYNNNDTTTFNSSIVGNTCDGMDRICDGVLLPKMEIGDYLYVNNIGAYSTASASYKFNGFSDIKEYYIIS